MTIYDERTALIVVDLQNDFADPSGTLFVTGGDEVVAPVNRQIIQATANGALVIYTQDWHPPSTPHFQKDGGIWPVHCVRDSWGAELHPRLIVAGPVIRKGTNGEDGYSGFTMRHPQNGSETPTELGRLLDEHRISDAAVVGLALDYCVGATALDARMHGLNTRVSLAHTAAVELAEGDGARMVAVLRTKNVTVD